MTAQTALHAIHAYLTKNPRSSTETLIDALAGDWTTKTIRASISLLNRVGALITNGSDATGQPGRPALQYSIRKTMSRKAAIAAVNAYKADTVRLAKRRKVLAANAAKARAALARQRAAKQAANTIVANNATKSARRSAQLIAKSTNPWAGTTIGAKRDTGLSLAEQLALQLSTRIQAGKIAAGTQIPGENKLGELNNLAHATAGRAIRAMAHAGLLVKVGGRYQVAKVKTKATRKAA